MKTCLKVNNIEKNLVNNFDIKMLIYSNCFKSKAKKKTLYH